MRMSFLPSSTKRERVPSSIKFLESAGLVRSQRDFGTTPNIAPPSNLKFPHCIGSVSYTHLDVYKRQCMNIFTLNQVDRFNTVLANSVRRKELLTSNALTPVSLVSNDGEVVVLSLIHI